MNFTIESSQGALNTATLFDIDGDSLLDVPAFDGVTSSGIFNSSIFPVTFFPGTTSRIDRDTRFADFNQDGFVDAFQNVYSPFDNEQSRIRIFFGSEYGFVENTQSIPNYGGYGETILVFDVDGDGDVDIYNPAYAISGEIGSYLLLNDGLGLFSDATDMATVDGANGALSLFQYDSITGEPINTWLGSGQPEGAQALDFNFDGLVDIYVASRLFINLGNLSFLDKNIEIGLPQQFDEGAVFADFDSDGDLDFIILDPQFELSIYLSEAGIYSEANGLLVGDDGFYSSNFGVNVFDVDSDGYLDIYINGTGGSPAKIFVNDQHGKFYFANSDFSTILSFFDPGYAAPIASDFNLDGALDIFQNRTLAIAQPNGTLASIKIEILGSNSEQNQFGRIAFISSSDDASPIQTRVVDGGTGYMSQGDYSLTVPLIDNSVKNVSISPFYFGDRGYEYTISSGFSSKVYSSSITSEPYVSITPIYDQLLQNSPRIIGGGWGTDSLVGSNFSDTLYGGAGDDVLQGGDGSDLLVGELGNDTYYVDDAGDRVLEAAGEGTDRVYTTANWSMESGQEIEYLIAHPSASNLTLKGNELSNYLIGSSGDDQLWGGAGDDLLQGGDGNDLLVGEHGNDTLYGGNGDDGLNGQGGQDVAAGGAGSDSYYVDDAGDRVLEAAGEGTDRVYTTANWSMESGQEIEYLIAHPSASNLTLKGNELSNYLIGSSGDDQLWGGAGDDLLQGGDGNDLLVGEHGNDTLYGGNGDDKFVLDFQLIANQELVYLPDFNTNDENDKILIKSPESWGFKLTLNEVISPEEFFVNDYSIKNSEHLIYDDVDGKLFYASMDNNQSFAISLIAVLSAHLDLHANDFI